MEIFNFLKEHPLFSGVQEADYNKIQQWVHEEEFEKNEFIYYPGDQISSIGIVLSGQIHIIQEDFWGNRTIIASIGPDGMFGEAFVCGESTVMTVGVLAVSETTVIMLDYEHITQSNQSSSYGNLLIKNMLRIIAEKNMFLTEKMAQITKRSTKEKVMAYLSAESLHHDSNAFYIPFDRQQMADYLAVDRSALSSTLSVLKKEGRIDFNKNYFILYK